ncbi:MAG: 4Fe-4S binding protein [Anaerolineae bacterium]|nr:4Fe-4S binding protein [Anaerolineae bacterium]
MEASDFKSRQVIAVNTAVPAARPARPRSVTARRITDYAGVSAPHLEVVRNYANPLLFGPPVCDELVALVEHMFTEEEAALVQHIRLPSGKTAAAVAAAAHCAADEVRSILDPLARDKGLLLTFGEGEKKRYSLLPLVPGTFEVVLLRPRLDTLTDWHRRFAELFSELYETGFLADYTEYPLPAVRVLPVAESIEGHPMAVPSDHLEQVLDRYQVFGVALCQCRMTEQMLGRGCDRPLETCVAFGGLAEMLIRDGRMRQIERRDVLALKAEAESTGLATWVSEVALGRVAGGASCSCCGCCCHALRTISEFNAPGLIAPARFVPVVDDGKCTYCGKCAQTCPMGAIVVDRRARSYQYLPERCVGCGLCAVACDREHAIAMVPKPGHHEQPRGLIPRLFQLVPNYLRNAWSVWRKYGT